MILSGGPPSAAQWPTVHICAMQRACCTHPCPADQTCWYCMSRPPQERPRSKVRIGPGAQHSHAAALSSNAVYPHLRECGCDDWPRLRETTTCIRAHTHSTQGSSSTTKSVQSPQSKVRIGPGAQHTRLPSPRMPCTPTCVSVVVMTGRDCGRPPRVPRPIGDQSQLRGATVVTQSVLCRFAGCNGIKRHGV